MISPKSIVTARKAFEAWGFRATYCYPEYERDGAPPILRISLSTADVKT